MRAPAPLCSFFPVCVSRESHLQRAACRGNAGGQGAQPQSAGLRSVWRLQASPLCSECGAPRSSLLSTAKGQKEKEPWQQVKQALHEAPLLCRAEVKYLASLETLETPGSSRCGLPDAGHRSHLHWPEVNFTYTFCFSYDTE